MSTPIIRLTSSGDTSTASPKIQLLGTLKDETALVEIDALIGDCIVFTISGIIYQAEKDMTWEDWVDSAYNTGGFYLFTPPTSTTGYSYVLGRKADGSTGMLTTNGTIGISAHTLVAEHDYILG